MDPYVGFREFVLARGPALARTAYLLCGDRHAAEELVQEALAKAAGRWRYVHAGNPEGYVRRIMVNQHISWWRRFARRESPYADLTEFVGATPGGADTTVERLSLATALAALSPRQRSVIVLRYYEDLSEAEIAETLNISAGTVKRHAHMAMARLRRLVPTAADIEQEVTP